MKKRGSVILAVIFMFLIVFLGLSLLNFTLVHNRIVKARNTHETRSEKLHNLLILHLHEDSEKIKNTKFNNAVDNCNDYFNKMIYPDSKIKSVEINKLFSFKSRDLPLFKLTRVNFEIESISSNGRHKWKSESNFNIISGNIPFNFLPAHICPGNYSPAGEITGKSQISLSEKQYIHIPDHKIVFDIKKYLAEILGIDQENLTIASLKKLLGQSDDSQELRQGIYFPVSEETAGPIFVQGEVDKIILSVENEHQIIEIIRNHDYFKIRYSEDQFYYKSGGESGTGYEYFNEKIIINGNVNSLKSGSYPALSSGSHPVLIILGDLNINSSITGEIGRQSDKSDPHITIISAPSPFFLMNSLPVLIFNQADPINIHGSININGLIINKNSEVVINGNLYCRDIKNNGNISIINRQGLEPLSLNNFYIKDLAILKDFRTESIDELFEDEI